MFAALLACLFVVMTVTDRVACPDGCTDEAPAQTTAPHAAAPCALCLGWAPAPTNDTPRPSDVVTAHVPSLAPRLLTLALPTLERPPKAA
ncbi:MAG: hypothetical protein AB7I50_06525 [Vicinamibacterales bacterium]